MSAADLTDGVPGDGPTVVLVHGAWGHPNDFDDVVAGLAERGIGAVVADLPTMGDPSATALDDADHVAELARRVPGPVVLCGHSYGGVVITQAGADAPDVAHLVYLAAVVPDVGESMRDVLGTGPARPSSDMEVRDDGSTLLLGWAASDWDYPADALERMARHPRRPFADGGPATAVTAAAWRDLPSTYLIAERDASIPPVRQRELAERCGRVVELDSGHMVAHEHPGFLADLLADVATGTVDTP